MANILSGKRALIDKANSRVVIITSAAVFVLVFCGVATKTLVGQASYQNRVISAKKVAVKQLKDDLGAVSGLKTSYDAFSEASQNVLGGSSVGSGPQDGSNTKLVLDALPSSYDFPGLTTSLDKLLTLQKVNITSIAGTDEEATQSGNTSSSTPVPVDMPFQLSVSGNYDSIKNLISAFEKTIRPIQLQVLDISGDQDNLNMTITAKTYYQPAKSLNITTKEVK